MGEESRQGERKDGEGGGASGWQRRRRLAEIQGASQNAVREGKLQKLKNEERTPTKRQ